MPGVDSQDDVPRIVVPGQRRGRHVACLGPQRKRYIKVETETTGSTKTVRLKGVFKYDSRWLAVALQLLARYGSSPPTAAGNETRTQVDIAANNRGLGAVDMRWTPMAGSN